MNWHYQNNDQIVGPLSEESLKELHACGMLSGETLVRREGTEAWLRYDEAFSGISGHSPGAADARLELEHGTKAPASGISLPQSLKSLASNKQAAAVFADLRSMDFKAEIAPIDSNIFALIKKDFAFWAVSLLAIIPLVLVTLNDTQSQLTGFLLFFAAIWGVIFKKFILDETSGWLLPIITLFFTGIAGIRSLLFIYEYLPEFYMKLSSSENTLVAFFGGIFQTGVCEELCKIVPVLIYIYWKRKEAKPLTIVLIGVFSGLGFAAFENMHYANRAVLRSAYLTDSLGAAGLQEGVTSAMVNVLLRSMSSVFGHAIYSGIFSYFIALGHITRNRRVALGVVGLLVAATAHGLYNSFWLVQNTLPAVVTAAAFMLFYAYLTKLRLVMASRENVPEGHDRPV